MSKIKQDKIPIVLTDDNILKIAVEQGAIEDEFNWELTHEGNGKKFKSKEVLWLEWNENGTFKEKHDKPATGRSLIMSPFNDFFTWQTTDIKEILEEREGYVKFKTKNSFYTLKRLDK